MTKLPGLYLLIFLLVHGLSVHGQYSFQYVSGGGGDDVYSKVIELKNGNFVAIGVTGSQPEPNYIICLDPKGNKLWENYFAYHGAFFSGRAEDVCEASNGYIYVSGSVSTKPVYTKFDQQGHIVYDTAFIGPFGSNGGILFILDDSTHQQLIGFGGGSSDPNGAGSAFFKTTYDGAWIHHRYITQTSGYRIRGIHRSKAKPGYIAVCDSDLKDIFMFFLDTAGNYVSHKKLFRTAQEKTYYHVQLNDGKFVFQYYQIFAGYTKLTTYTENGDSIATIDAPQKVYGFLVKGRSNKLLLAGSEITLFDSNLNVVESHPFPGLNDSTAKNFIYEASDGGFIGGGTASYGPRIISDLYDFYLFKIAPEGYLTDTIQEHYLGMHTLYRNENIKIYPNPASEKFILKSENDESLSIEVFNQLGERMPVNGSQEIAVQNWPSGMYWLKATQLRSGSGATFKISVIH